MTRIMRPRRRLSAFGSAAAIVAVIAAPITAGAIALPAIASTSNSSAESNVRLIKDAEFNWSINDESTGGAYANGCNFLVAGKAGNNNGASKWKAKPGSLITMGADETLVDGNASIRKSDGRVAKYPERCLTAAGVKVDGKTNAELTDNHTGDYVKITGGTGTIDPTTDTGTISWKGSWTMAYYGGQTYWTISNPTLSVVNGHGTITGEYSGYGADQNDGDKWDELPKKTAEIINLQDAKVDLTEKGFTVTPDYLGVKSASAPDQANKSDANSKWWGAFPEPWVKYNQLTGQTSYWYTTSGTKDSIQPRKKTNSLEVSYVDNGPGDSSTLPSAPPSQEPTDTPTTPSTDDPSTPQPSDSPSPTASAEPSTPTTTADSPSLFWGINEESSSKAFAPNTCNFLVAGKAGDNKESKEWEKRTKLYRTQVGNTTVEKPNAQGTYAQPTWDNKCEDRNGEKLTNAKGSQSETRFVIKEGTSGDSAGGLTAAWKGSVTVAFYSGQTYWSFTDPTLTVNADGKGTLTATASGYGADQNNKEKWTSLKPQKITLANFSGVNVAQAKTDGGFTVTPDYKGVKVNTTGSAAQVRDGDDWGSFPQSFVDFNNKAGQSSYWYSSGGQRDFAKPAAPLTVALRAGYAPPSAGQGGNTTITNEFNSNITTNGGDNTVNGSSNNTVNSGGSGPAGASAPNGANPPEGNGDDNTVFAPAAQAARNEAATQELSTRQLIGAGAIGAGAIALTTGAGWLLRRRIGLDPHTWN